MSAILATLVCTAGILWSLYWDERNSPKLSPALWIPTLWIGIIASQPIANWIDGQGNRQQLFVDENGPPFDRLTFLFLTLAGIFILTRRAIDWKNMVAQNRVLLVFYIFLFASVFWSEYPLTALKRYIKEIGNIVMLLIMLTDKNPTKAVERVLLRCAVVLVPLSILFIKYYDVRGRYYNGWTGEQGLNGVTTSKNELGRLAMWSALTLLWSLRTTYPRVASALHPRKALHHVVIFAMCLWIILNAHSQTSLVCFFIGIAVFFISRTRVARESPQAVVIGTSLFLLATLIFFSVPGLRASIAEALGRRGNLTDRTDVWRECLAVDTNPLIGEGFFSFWLTEAGHSIATKLAVTEAHNGFLETYLNSGIIGVFLLALVLIHTARNALFLVVTRAPLGPLFATFFIAGIIYNYTEATFNNNNIVGVLIFMVAIRYSAPVYSAVAEVARPKPEMSRM